MFANIFVTLFISFSSLLPATLATVSLPSTFAATRQGICQDKEFFGLPTWYKYLNMKESVQVGTGQKVCEVDFSLKDSTNGSFNGRVFILIALAITEILLRLGGLVAVAFVIYGGFKLISSQGEPNGAKESRETIINALVGLVITIVASAIVSFIGNKLG